MGEGAGAGGGGGVENDRLTSMQLQVSKRKVLLFLGGVLQGAPLGDSIVLYRDLNALMDNDGET